MPPQQTCICLTHPVYAKCENGCVFVTTKPQSIIATAVQWNTPTCRCSSTQRFVSWYSPVVAKVWIKTQRRVEKGQKMDHAEAIQTGVLDFQRHHCLSVCTVDTCEKSRLLTLKTNLATCCQKSSHNQYFFHTLFEAWVTSCSPKSDLGHAIKVWELSD